MHQGLSAASGTAWLLLPLLFGTVTFYHVMFGAHVTSVDIITADTA